MARKNHSHKYGSFHPIPLCGEWKIVTSYKEGKTQTKIANENDMTQVSVWRILKKYKVQIRKKLPKTSVEIQLKIVDLYNRGFSMNEISKEINSSFATVRLALIRNDIHIRSVGALNGENNPSWKGGVNKDKKHISRRHADYCNRRKKTDPFFKLLLLLRSRTCRFFKSAKMKKTLRTSDLLGADVQTVFYYIEAQFSEGMTWDNHGIGEGKWNIDHIIPLASAETEKELIKLFHYTNLQPLWAIDNLRKGVKLSWLKVG